MRYKVTDDRKKSGSSWGFAAATFLPTTRRILGDVGP